MRTRFFFIIVLLACILAPWRMQAQQPVFSQQHGFCEEPFLLTITSPAGQDIRYTLDASEPTAASPLYSAPLNVSSTTIVRAAVFEGGTCVSPVLTATYLFVDDILSQSNTPEGYPSTWGRYTTINGTAQADYEMDPEMTEDPILRPKIVEGLQSLPVVSIVTDRDNLFSHENDSVRGGIYIFTGPPVGDGTGHGWTRPASVEMFGPAGQLDFSTTCGLRLHGGHGRLAEKNPKHSFRLVFKEQYGPKSLKYPLFGEDEPQKFDQLVLRCHFGNSWQHWDEGNRKKAQYSRDVWARRMQRRMGRTSVNALYVNLFINGMYWGLYNLAERVDDQFGKDYLGGKKDDIDVVKIEEDGGNHIEAAEGTLDAWRMMTSLAAIVGGSQSSITPDEAYQQLQDSLLDIDNFIDYMLINQYGGNTDWDHHNWYALRRRGADSQGFRFLCWDSEIIQENVRENVLNKNNGSSFPTGIFHNLLRNDNFARRYLRRAKVVFAENGPLGQASVVEVWDSLHAVIAKALYAEAARWGDYRRDVHKWQSAGQLYTVDNHYEAERQRLLTQYFPYRSDNVLNQITAFVNVDDFEAPEGWERLMSQMFHEWDGNAIDSQPLDKKVNVDWNMGVNAGGGTAIAGFGNVEWNKYADLSRYESLVLRGSGSGLRVLANRLTDHGPYKQIVVSFNEGNNYWDSDLGAIVLPLEDLKTVTTNEGVTRVDDFVHLHVLKVNWGSNACVNAAWLVPKVDAATIACDVNGDGHVDVADISSIISYMSGMSDIATDVADTNGDGQVDVADIATVISAMAAASR
ncbi:MAG: CotH kinase family protein [Prevotella sp.]|nr:CotH kinase family protein [Prevotella sp.]